MCVEYHLINKYPLKGTSLFCAIEQIIFFNFTVLANLGAREFAIENSCNVTGKLLWLNLINSILPY